MKILFVCSANVDRSTTAARIYKNHPRLEVESAGTAWYAQTPVNKELLLWADAILCMEKKHKQYIVEDFSAIVSDKLIDYLDIEDVYPFMHPSLVEIIKEKVDAWLFENQTNFRKFVKN